MILRLITSCARGRIQLKTVYGRIQCKNYNFVYKKYVKVQPNFIQVRHLHKTLLRNAKESRGPGDPERDDKKRRNRKEAEILATTTVFWVVISYIVVILISLLFPTAERSDFISYVSWNEFFYQMLAKGEVERILVNPDYELVTIILHKDAIIKGNAVKSKVYHMNIAGTDQFEEKLRKSELTLGVSDPIPLDYIRHENSSLKLAMGILITFLVLLLIKIKPKSTPIMQDVFGQMGRAKYTLIDPVLGHGKGVKFADVAGLKEAKIEIKEFVDYLTEPKRYRILGAKVPKGALLLGPPGCGKTLLAKAVATESEVPFLSMNGSEFIEMMGGLGAARVRNLFKEARKRSPCIVYIDEIDAIGKKRFGGGGGFGYENSEADQTLNQLLVEMDGLISKENIMVMASTNRPDMLDKALLRPGRFDRHILIDLPTLNERKDIFDKHLQKIVLEKDPTIYSWKLCHSTAGFSGADIANVVNEAALHAARLKKKRVQENDLEYAVERMNFGSEKKNHTMTKEEREISAFHESGHAIVGWFMENADPLIKVSIQPRTNSASGFTQYATTDKHLLSKEELITKMCVLLGGRAAEVKMFNRTTTGAQNDLNQVTKMAYSMVNEYGMSENVGLMSFEKNGDRKPYSKALKAMMDVEVRRLVGEVYFRTEEFLEKHRTMVKMLAEGLIMKETMGCEDIESLIGPSPNRNKTN